MKKAIALCTILWGAIPAYAQGLLPPAKDSSLVKISYGNKGFEFETRDNRFSLQIQSRLQFRFATPGDQDPATLEDFTAGRKTVFKINRARLKVGGHAYKPWLSYYWEYELSQSNLLDFRIMIEPWPWLKFKFGQWKVEYTRERFISSGEQQMVERSLINKPFTLDRQQGATVYGRIKIKGPADFSYWGAVLTGNGRGAKTNDDNKLMYSGRFQWNVFGRELEFEGGDLELHEKPAGIIALCAVTNNSPYTRFSQSGGGQLEGFETPDSIRYRVNQWQLESAFMYKGFSWQEEYHHKYIRNDQTGQMTTLMGYYMQAGYFFHQALPFFPEHLELAGRFAQYRPDVSLPGNRQQEYSSVANYFFKGHKNKLTAEATYFDFEDKTLENQASGWRFRLQWDISF